MNAGSHRPLLDELAKLGRLYPGMRFGQLLEFASLLAAEGDGPDLVGKADDAAVHTAIRNHSRQRTRPTGVQPEDGFTGLPPTRSALLTALEEVWDRHPDWRFGEAVVRVAESAGVNTYDIEDEQLLAAARDHLGGLAAV